MEAGKVLVYAGAFLLLLGLLLLYFPKLFAWFGRLPGDIRIEREGLRVYIPTTLASWAPAKEGNPKTAKPSQRPFFHMSRRSPIAFVG